MIVYTIVSPLMGWLGDRYNRRYCWPSASGSGASRRSGRRSRSDFWHMFFWRALLGVGEASYGVMRRPLLADLFAPKHRGRVMGVYFLALPLGGALGYAIGGWVARWHWQAAFWVVGLPGLLAAAAGLVIHDPGRGASEGYHQPARPTRPGSRDYLDLFRTPSFVFNTAGMAAVTFAHGRLCRLGLDVLPDGPRHDLDEGGALDRRPDRRGRAARHRRWGPGSPTTCSGSPAGPTC